MTTGQIAAAVAIYLGVGVLVSSLVCAWSNEDDPWRATIVTLAWPLALVVFVLYGLGWCVIVLPALLRLGMARARLEVARSRSRRGRQDPTPAPQAPSQASEYDPPPPWTPGQLVVRLADDKRGVAVSADQLVDLDSMPPDVFPFDTGPMPAEEDEPAEA